MLLEFHNTDSDGNPTTDELAVTVQNTRYEIATEGSQLVEVPDEVGEYMLSEGYAVEEASSAESEQQVSNAVETQAVDDEAVGEAEAEAEAPAEKVGEPAVEIERESDGESVSESATDNDLPEV